MAVLFTSQHVVDLAGHARPLVFVWTDPWAFADELPYSYVWAIRSQVDNAFPLANRKLGHRFGNRPVPVSWTHQGG